jgi:hypothetical protein
MATVEQRPGHGRLERLAVVPLTGCDVDGNDATVAGTDDVDLGAETAAGTPQRMVRVSR